MFLSDLQSKDIINLNDGKNLGKIVDIELNNDGSIKTIIAEKRKLFKRFFSNGEFSFAYSDIEKIGDDVILIRM